jgi:hypothetical protein
LQAQGLQAAPIDRPQVLYRDPEAERGQKTDGVTRKDLIDEP